METFAIRDANRRQFARTSADLPAWIGKRRGMVRDIGAGGMFLVQTAQQETGSQIDYLIQLDMRAGTMKLRGKGIVVRVEPTGQDFGIGIEIRQQFGMQLILQALSPLGDPSLRITRD